MKEKVTVDGREYFLFPVDTLVLVGNQKAVIQERIITEQEKVFYKLSGQTSLYSEDMIVSFKTV